MSKELIEQVKETLGVAGDSIGRKIVERIEELERELFAAQQALLTGGMERDEAVSAVQRLSSGQPFDVVVIADTVKRRTATIERDRDALRVDYHRACQTVAEMHAAAMGAAVGPVRGVVEDVADLKAERDGWKASAENRLEIQGQRERRIEELEREVKRLSKQSANRLIGLCKCGLERDALQADNARLRDLLKQWAFTHTDDETVFMEIHDALAATPEQSADALKERIRADAFAEVADKLEALRSRLNKVLATKEPE